MNHQSLIKVPILWCFESTLYVQRLPALTLFGTILIGVAKNTQSYWLCLKSKLQLELYSCLLNFDMIFLLLWISSLNIPSVNTRCSASYSPKRSLIRDFFFMFLQNLRALHRFIGFAVPERTLFAPHVHRLQAVVWCCWATLDGFDQQNTMYFLCSLIQTKHEHNWALLCEGWGLHAFLIRLGLLKMTTI